MIEVLQRTPDGLVFLKMKRTDHAGDENRSGFSRKVALASGASPAVR